MLNIVVQDLAPLSAVVAFIIVGIASWGQFKKYYIENLEQAVAITKGLAEVATTQNTQIKAQMDDLRRTHGIEIAALHEALRAQERRVIRVEIDLDRKTRLLNAARSENEMLEKIVGVTVAALNKAGQTQAKTRADGLILELSEQRKKFQADQEAWEDAQTVLHLQLGDTPTMPANRPAGRLPSKMASR